MKNSVKYICLLPFALILFTVFVLKPGFLETSRIWIYISFGLIPICTIVNFAINKNEIKLNWVDGLFTLFYITGFVVSLSATVTHDIKIELFTLLIILYFSFRVFLSQSHFNKYWLTIIYILSILAYSTYGLLLWLNIIPSATPGKVISPNFANAGLYAGYLVIALPLTTYFIIKDSVIFRKKQSKQLNAFRFRWILSLVTTILAAFIIYKIDRRAPILSVLISLPVMLVAIRWKTIKKFILRRKLLSFSFMLLIISLLAVTLFKLYHKNDNSSNIRYKIAIVSLNTIANNIGGTGIGCFSEKYNEEQIKFNEGQKNNSEKLHFESPFAYNEFLQIGVEFGIIGAILFLSTIFLSIYKGFSFRKYGFVGSLIALQVFSCMWYPYLFISFIICLLFFIANCVTKFKKHSSPRTTPAILFILLIASFLCVIFGMRRQKAYSDFEQVIHNPAETSNEKYEQLYPYLKNDTRFMMNYSAFLSNHNPEKTIEILNKLKCISSKKETFLALAKNHLLIGDTVEAENNLSNYYILNPGNKKVDYSMADFYLKIKDIDKAEKHIIRIRKTDTTSHTIKTFEEQLKILKTKPE